MLTRFRSRIVKTLAPLAAAAAAVAVLSVGEPAQASAAAGWHHVYYSGQTQQKDNWCGPAAAATVLTNWRISGVSQKTLASEMITKVPPFTGFTSPYDLSKGLNHWIKLRDHWKTDAYKVYDNSPTSDMGNQKLWDLATRDVNLGRAAVILVQSRKIPWGGGSFGEAHYLVIVGYNTNYNGKAAYSIWDPAPGGGIHTLAKNDFDKMAWGTSFYGRFVIA